MISWGTCLSAKRIEDANQKCDVLLYTCGEVSYTLVQNLVIPNPPTQNSPTNLETFIDSLVFLGISVKSDIHVAQNVTHISKHFIAY